MTTAAKIRANRLNAKRNTGPSTSEAKAHVAQNGIKHGLTAQQTVLSHENVDEFHDLMGTFISEYQPINTREALCVERIARHHWRMLRAGRVETAMFEHRIDTLIRQEHAEEHPNPDYDAGISVCYDQFGKEIELHRRYEATIERAYYRAVADLEKMQGKRHKSKPVIENGIASQNSACHDQINPATTTYADA
jgi:hypothetical protein